MKTYMKLIDNQEVIKLAKDIILHKNGKQIINPTEAMLISDGWVEYNETPAEFTNEVTVDAEKENLIDKIYTYDSSTSVNSFFVNGVQIWLDKATRAGLMLRIQAEIAMGLEETTLWYDSYEFKLPLSNAMQMLYAIEVYASQCYDRTQYHIAMVKKLNTIEEIKAYNYTIGYPEKLNF